MFVFDTNSLSVLKNYYPDVHETFWKLFNEAADNGVVTSVREVRKELDGFGDGHVLEWANARTPVFPTPSAAEAAFVGRIFSIPHFTQLIGEKQMRRGSPVADPFVVAAAQVKGFTVVTEEAHKRNAARIPNVCEHFDISWTDLRGFLLAQRWRF